MKISTEYSFLKIPERIPINGLERKLENPFLYEGIWNGLEYFFPFCEKNGRPLSWNRDKEAGFLNSDFYEWIIREEREASRKINMAKTVLKEITHYYSETFKDLALFSDSEILEKQFSFNSSLMHLMASMDENEDNVVHSLLVSRYTLLLSKALGIEDRSFLVDIERGAALHDIGKIGIPQSILRKPGPLTLAEKEIIKEHPLIGYEIIRKIEFLVQAEPIVLFHHERYDGTGYPFGLIGQEIPLEARIFAVADTIDAITSERSYREIQSYRVAYKEIEKERGLQFDPDVVDAFLSVPEEKWHHVKRGTENSLQFYPIH